MARIRTKKELLLLIDSLRDTDSYIRDIYLNGGCYQFHLFLKKLIPECEPRISITGDHIVTLFKGSYFDIRGIVEGFFEPLSEVELRVASKWSFSKHKLLQISECHVCGEPIVT